MSFDYIIPKKNKVYLCKPKYKEWLSMANKSMIDRLAWNFNVCGTEAPKFKDAVKKDILTSAYSFCREKNIKLKEKDFNSYVFTTGHQATFYHPGVWIKNFLINEYSKNDNITGLNIWLDYEEGCQESFSVPYVKSGNLHKKNIPFNVPFCANVSYMLAPPTGNLWECFYSQIKALLKTLPGDKPLKNFEHYRESAKYAFGVSKNLSEFISLSRRHFEGDRNYLELPASIISGHESFLAFFLDILNKIDVFNLIYNDVLYNYREAHSIRSDANPFPSLRLHDNLYELPFWVILPGGQRAGLWYDKSKNSLYAKNEKILKLSRNNDSSIEILKNSEYRIIFKAVTLMMYFRTFVSDLFLHGVGGAKYDVITDEIIQKYYKIKPPSYASATLTLYMDLPDVKYNEKERFETEKKLIQIKHNP
ncbi:MAG: hypothetical protein ABIH00_07245, partial [Armatimonadota bacterium]